MSEQTSPSPSGVKAKGKKWPWIIGGLLLLGIIASAAGGSDTATNSGEQSSNQSGQQKDADSVYKVAEAVKVGKSVITVNQVQFSQGGAYYKPQTGNEWVNLNLTIENTDDSNQYVTTLGQMFVRDAAGNSYQVASTDKAIEDINSRLDGSIIAKSKRTGWVGFEIPKGSTGLQFQYNGSMWGGGNILVDLGR